MSVFTAADFHEHEAVAFFHDKASGLKSIIAVHSTALGNSCGGVRMYPYASDDEAVADVLRLSRGMSYKSAIAGLPLGGGKAVIIGDPATEKTESRLLAFADAVNALGGRYITAMDVGVTQKDMPVIAGRTEYVAGYDQPGKTGGDSGPWTALGVFLGLKAAVKQRLERDSTRGLKVAIQGLGKVGMAVARQLHEEGANLLVADVNAEAVQRASSAFGAQPLPVDEIVTAACDVLSPNALGAILDDVSVPKVKAKVIAGGANNQLARQDHGEALRGRGILYAPDYVINGGGIIAVAGQMFDWSDAEIERRVRSIAETLSQIFRRAASEGAPTSLIADCIAEERMAAGKNLRAQAAE
ncbi:MAG: Glu/Leu/Phe/Val dehydrogenase [Alphaproteobacteria bacterium]|nr:Glu/Leu/Phe/Val dehydrogenase [Alphaproteobacteria bacterium]